jgi:hypothetical protein
LSDFFISYAREDGQFVDRLRAALTARIRQPAAVAGLLARCGFTMAERADCLRR